MLELDQFLRQTGDWKCQWTSWVAKSEMVGADVTYLAVLTEATPFFGIHEWHLLKKSVVGNYMNNRRPEEGNHYYSNAEREITDTVATHRLEYIIAAHCINGEKRACH